MQLTGRTDMAAEFVKGKNGIRCESYELYGEKITEIIVSEKDTALFNRPCGRYFTVDSTDVPYADGQIHALCLTSSYRKENVLSRGLETRL